MWSFATGGPVRAGGKMWYKLNQSACPPATSRSQKIIVGRCKSGALNFGLNLMNNEF